MRQVDGVDGGRGRAHGTRKLVVDGEVVDTFGAPGLVIADAHPASTRARSSPAAIRSRPGEATVLATERRGPRRRDRRPRSALPPATACKPVTVVGIIRFGEGGLGLGGATVIELRARTARRLVRPPGQVSSISVIGDAGVDPAALARSVSAVLPGDARAQTASENAAENADEINDQIGSFLTPALLALAGASVLVGAFIIFNTFSITVAQRMREFAMLRALGATRGQVLGIVAAEALAIGVVASALGILARARLRQGAQRALRRRRLRHPSLGLDPGPAGPSPSAIGVGVGVTLIAALVPARAGDEGPAGRGDRRCPRAESGRSRRSRRDRGGRVLAHRARR